MSNQSPTTHSADFTWIWRRLKITIRRSPYRALGMAAFGFGCMIVFGVQLSAGVMPALDLESLTALLVLAGLLGFFILGFLAVILIAPGALLGHMSDAGWLPALPRSVRKKRAEQLRGDG